MPQVSVIIPAYNASRYIKETIDSALSQTCKDIEIVVVDDGSTDNTKDIVTQYAICNTPYVKYIYQANKGPAAARNNGIRASSGEFIAFLDADDVWLPEKIEKQLNKFNENPGYGLVHARRVRMDVNGLTLPTPEHNIPEGLIFNELLKRNFIYCSSVLVRKACFDGLGMFDERKNVDICEDYDMWLRIAEKYTIGFVTEPLVRYRVNPAGHCRSKLRSAYAAEQAVFMKALARYKGDKEELKRKRLQDLRYRMADSFFYVRDYPQAISAFIKGITCR